MYIVLGGITGRNRGEFGTNVSEVIAKMLLNEGQITGTLTYKSLDLKTEYDKYNVFIGNKKTGEVKASKVKICYMHKVIANDIEREINTFNKPELAELLGFRLKNPKVTKRKADITVKNDVTPGNITIDLLSVHGAHDYVIECTLHSETGGPDIITTLRTTNCYSYFSGFVSGGKYSFRSQAIMANNTLVRWTGAVILRIN